MSGGDIASATVLVQVAIGDKGLSGLLGSGLSVPFDKHAVMVQIVMDSDLKERVRNGLALLCEQEEKERADAHKVAKTKPKLTKPGLSSLD